MDYATYGEGLSDEELVKVISGIGKDLNRQIGFTLFFYDKSERENIINKELQSILKQNGV